MTTSDQPFITRFAPSPTGLLHLGSAFSALVAFDLAREKGGRFLLRIEDIDTSRCRPEFEEAIYEDLDWLGIEWEEPVRIQSNHFADYDHAAQKLIRPGLTYPCFCTRTEIAEEIARSTSAPHGPEGALYPGTCRHRSLDEQNNLIAQGKTYAIRLDIARAVAHLADKELAFVEEGAGPEAQSGPQTVVPGLFGDVVIMRKDTPASYHLAATSDDALQGMTHIVRGQDLFFASHIQCVLQELLGLPRPHYFHHHLILDESGRRLAKRDKDMTIRALRQAGETPQSIRKRLGL